MSTVLEPLLHAQLPKHTHQRTFLSSCRSQRLEPTHQTKTLSGTDRSREPPVPIHPHRGTHDLNTVIPDHLLGQPHKRTSTNVAHQTTLGKGTLNPSQLPIRATLLLSTYYVSLYVPPFPPPKGHSEENLRAPAIHDARYSKVSSPRRVDTRTQQSLLPNT